MKHRYNVIIEKDADGYLVASVPSLPGCHTQAKSLDALMKRIKGSHHFLRHPDGRSTVIPVHAGEGIGIGLLGKIPKDVEWTNEDLLRQL